MVVASSAVEADRAIAFPTARITGCVALILSTLDDGNEFPKDLRGWLWRYGPTLSLGTPRPRTNHLNSPGEEALGTIYSFLLEKAGAQVTAVCRSNYVTIQGKPRIYLNLVSRRSSFSMDFVRRTRRRCAIAEIRGTLYTVVDSVENAALAEESFDYIVCTFKCLPDLQTTPQILGPLLARSSNFVLIQNGIGIELDLQQAAPAAVVMSGCAWIDATIIDHGRTLKHGPLERLVIGVHPPPGTSPKVPQTPAAHTALAAFVDLLKSAGATAEQTHNIDAARWKKIICASQFTQPVLRNAGFSTFATLGNATLPDICHEPARSYTIPIVVAVARAQGVNESDLPLSSIDEAVDLTLSEYGVGGPAYKASMLVDFLAERPMEIEVIIGGVLRYAHGSNVPTPRLSTAYALLKVHQTRFMQKSKPRDA
ncbi:2-dehydropantoate 2-reductase [Ceratobasidium sp. AG-Ba]|nr:2-dehydropantoate 2-reductase [Ceratobasidium sp. AG-Ba]